MRRVLDNWEVLFLLLAGAAIPAVTILGADSLRAVDPDMLSLLAAGILVALGAVGALLLGRGCGRKHERKHGRNGEAQ